MPIAFHSAACDHLSRDDQRARREQRTHALGADEHRQRSGRETRDLQFWSDTIFAGIRVACAVSVLLAVFCALVSQAQAMPGSWPHLAASRSGEMPSDHGDIVAVGRTLRSGHYVIRPKQGPRAATGPNAPFDWADATVGAGSTVVLGLLVGAAALASRRRRAGGGLNAGRGG